MSGLFVLPSITLPMVLLVIGGSLTLLSNLMRRMVPLRVFAVGANAAFVVENMVRHDWFNVCLQLCLLSVNAFRLWDLQRLLRTLAQANTDTPLQDWLLPYMQRKTFKAGTTIFAKGDVAHQLVYIQRGQARLEGSNAALGPGSLIGEIGLFTADRKRTATVVCVTSCRCYTMTDEAIYLLYFQNPKLGFFLIRLIVQRLLQDLQRHEPTAAV